jgi:mRNA interferase MazF
MFKKGTLVLVPFPFTDLSGNKVRPALIVSQGKIGNDVVVVFVTSQRKSKEKNLVSIVPDPQNGLKIASHIVCSKIATLDAKTVLGELGSISSTTQQSVDTELRKVLGL